MLVAIREHNGVPVRAEVALRTGILRAGETVEAHAADVKWGFPLGVLVEVKPGAAPAEPPPKRNKRKPTLTVPPGAASEHEFLK